MTLFALYLVALLAAATVISLSGRNPADVGRRHFTPLMMSLFVVAGIAIRSQLFFWENADVRIGFAAWARELGDFSGMARFYEFSDYAPGFLYFLAFVAKHQLPVGLAVKSLMTLVDLLIAAGIALCAREFTGTQSRLPVAAFGAAFLAPSLIVNSAMWGQIDAIYTVFIVFAVYELLRNRTTLAILYWGTALAFKLQSVFVFVPFLALFLTRRITAIKFLAVPVPYLVLGVPAVLLGAHWKSVLEVYLKQTQSHSGHFTLNAPTIFALLPGLPAHNDLATAGTLAALFAGVSIAAIAATAPGELSPRRLVLLAFISAVIIPFLLPRMHERYFYTADVLSVLFAFIWRRDWWISPLVIGCSLSSYIPFLLLRNRDVLFDNKYVALVMLFVIMRLGALFIREFYERTPEAGENA